MRRSKVHEGIGGRKIIAIRLRMRCAPFHLILGHEDGAQEEMTAQVAVAAAVATVDHSDIRGSKPHNRDPSGAASDLQRGSSPEARRIGFFEESPFRVPPSTTADAAYLVHCRYASLLTTPPLTVDVALGPRPLHRSPR